MLDEKRGIIFNSNKEIVMIALRVRDVYVLDVTFSAQESCFFAKATKNHNWIWHKRLAHLNFKTINQLAKQNLVIGLSSLVYSKEKPCLSCEKGKHHRANCKTKQTSSIKKCLYLLHMDLFGPVSPRSINHEKYTLVIVDEYSRYIWVYFLKKRSQAPEIIMSFIKRVKNKNDIKVKQHKTNNGTEFRNSILVNFYDERVIDLKLCYNTFKFKEGESLTQTFTRYKALMNELVHDGIKLLKLEISIGFINRLPKKWLSFCQSLRNTNSVKDSELASLSDSLDDEEGTRSSHEYLNDLEEEYQARDLLAKSKRFFKKEEVSSDDNEMVEVKVIMAQAEENDAISKEGARNGLKDIVFVKSSIDDTKVTIPGVERPRLSEAEGFILPNHDTGRILPSDLQRNTTDSSVAVTDSSVIDYDLADESSVCSISLPPLKKLDCAEPISGPKTIKSILRSKFTFKAEALKDVTINKLTLAPAKGNKSSSASKVHSAPAGKLKNVKIKDDPPLAIVMKELNNLKLQFSKNQSSHSRNDQSQHTPQNKYKTQFKKSCEMYGLNNHLTKNYYKVLFCKKCKKTDHRTCDHAEYIYTINMSQHLKSLSRMSSRPNIPRPSKRLPCIYCGGIDHLSNECLYYPICKLCGSYDHDTNGHNRIISPERKINPRNPLHAFKKCKVYGSLNHTTTDHYDIEWLRRGEALQEKNAKSLKNLRLNHQMLTDPRLQLKRCSRHMNGVKSYLYKYVEQPRPKVVFGDDSTCITEGYGSIKCNGLVFTKVAFVNGLKYNLISISQLCDAKYIVQFDEKRGTIFNSNKEVVMISPRVRDVYVLNMTNSSQESCFFAKAFENLNWIWHKRLAHLNFKTINKMAKIILLLGFHHLSTQRTNHASHVKKESIIGPTSKQNRHLVSRNVFIFFTWIYLDLQLLATACYTQNRSTIVKKHLKTPYEIFRKRIPNINFLHVFGCPVYIHNDKDHLGKFDEKANDGYLLRYSLISKAFRVFNTRRQQTEETYHITFDESLDAIKFSKSSVDNINIAESKRYPPDEYLYPYESSQMYQTNNNDVSFIEPYESPDQLFLKLKFYHTKMSRRIEILSFLKCLLVATVIPTETPIITPTIPPSHEYTPTSPDYSPASDIESNPSEDPSSGHIPQLPAVSPFLSSKDDTTDSDTLDTPPSPTHGTPFTEITSFTQRSPVMPRRRVMILAPGHPIPHYSSSEASSNFHSDASSDSSSRHSLSDHSSPDLLSTSAGPSRKRRRELRILVINPRVVVEAVDRDKIKTGVRGPVEVIEGIQREQGCRIVGVESAVNDLTERVAELQRDNRRLRGTASVESQRVDRLQRDMSRSLGDKIICDLDKTPDFSQRPPQNCPKCGNLVDGHYCQGYALLRKKFKEDQFTYCIGNEILQDSSKPSNDNTNVVNALQNPFVVNQDPEDIFCHQCTYELCGNGAHYGFNYLPKVLIILNPESFNNQTVDELPQTLPSFDPSCYSKDGNSFTYDSTSNLVHDSPNVFDPPLQLPLYSCEFCRNGAHYYHEQNSSYDPNSFGFDQFQPPQYTVNHLIFNVQNDLYNSQNKLMEQMTSMCDMVGQFLQKKEGEKQIEEEQAAKTRYWKILACYDDDNDDDDYTIAITHKEPDNSLSMGDEHLDTIPATESDEFIKSSVENLVPNLSESEGENKCDVPAESLLNHDSSIISSSLKIDSLFDEFAGELTLLKLILPIIKETDCDPEEETHFIKRLLYDNSSPHPPEEFVSKNSDAAFESFSLFPIPVEDSDSLMEEINLSFTPDYQMPPGIEEDDYDSERDILILKELLSNDSLSFPENESFHFDMPSSSRPPAKPPDGNSRILNVKVMGDISEHKVPMPKLMSTQSTLVPNQEKSPDLLSHLGHEAFQLSAECSMIIYEKNTPILDVLFFHFYPP
nr:retrovirus-related Pol polyprotein from transposon TNT 1-94 [Tanacetum cinerariifolium]